MADDVDTFIQLPDDSGNTGKKTHYQSKVDGGNTIYEPYVIPSRAGLITGVYMACTAPLAISATVQNGTSTGFLWITNPVANTTRSCRIRRIFGTSQHSTALATINAARIALKQMTFTGTPSGAALTPAKLKSAYASATFDIRTAVTGLTPTVGALVGDMAIVGALTAVGAYAPEETSLFGPFGNEDEYYTLAPGEGCVVYQDVAGTTSDTRFANLCILWDEIDIS